MDICMIDGCERPRRNKSSEWCNSHWMRWYRHGDPLAGRSENGEPHQFLADHVLPYRGDACIDWPYACDGHGYARINSAGKIRLVTRIVCEDVNGPPPTLDHQAAHSCGRGNQGCVTPRHLRWATQSENEADKYTHGTRKRAA